MSIRSKSKKNILILPTILNIKTDFKHGTIILLIVSVKRYHRSARIGTIIAEEPVPL